MTYPSASAAPSIYTEHVNGIKFDICEVVPGAYNMLIDNRYRFFLAVEDTFIVNYAAAEQLYEATGEVRWDFFCRTRGECLAMIRDFEAKCDQVSRWRLMMQQKSGISPMILPKIGEADSYCIRRFGVNVAA